MSDNTQHIDVDSDEFEGTPKALRDRVKRLQKQNSDLAQQITGLQGELTATALSDVLTGFTKPERVKSALLADGIDPLNREAVDGWLKDNGDDFARAAGNPAAPTTDQTQPDERQAQRDALNAVTQIGQPGAPDGLAKIKAVPADLSPQATYQWLVENTGA